MNLERKYNPPVHMAAGAAAGACAAAVTTPLDVIKTLLNTQETGLTRGMIEASRKVNIVLSELEKLLTNLQMCL